jgi:hypothetical protein
MHSHVATSPKRGAVIPMTCKLVHGQYLTYFRPKLS